MFWELVVLASLVLLIIFSIVYVKYVIYPANRLVQSGANGTERNLVREIVLRSMRENRLLMDEFEQLLKQHPEYLRNMEREAYILDRRSYMLKSYLRDVGEYLFMILLTPVWIVCAGMFIRFVSYHLRLIELRHDIPWSEMFFYCPGPWPADSVALQWIWMVGSFLPFNKSLCML